MLSFIFNNLSYTIMFTALLVGFCALLAARGERIFSSLLVIALLGIAGIIFTADLFTLYLFIELVALASFVMIAQGQNPRAYEGAFKYLLLSVMASVFMLTGIALTLLYADGTSFELIRAAALIQGTGFLPMAALSFFMAGLFIKGGLVPFHGWVPDAYSAAPRAVSVFLAGIVTKVSGIYAIIKLILFVFPAPLKLNALFLLFGIISVFVGALAALGQKELRRMLAYSSISQVGYIMLGLGVGTRLGIVAAVFHFFNHAVMKSQLFINAAAIEEETGTAEIDKLGGLAQKMPVTSVTTLIASLSTAGIPPLAGFWSKLLIVMALWFSGHYAFALLAVLGSLITLGYFLMLQRKLLFGQLAEGLEKVKEASISLLFPALLLCGITIVIGVALFLWCY